MICGSRLARRKIIGYVALTLRIFSVFFARGRMREKHRLLEVIARDIVVANLANGLRYNTRSTFSEHS